MKIKEYFVADICDKIFVSLAINTNINTYPFLKALIFNNDESYIPSANELDLLYMSHSANKDVSPLLIMMLDEDVMEDVSHRTTALMDIILMKYGYNWNRVIESYLKQYNPIENYAMVEDEKTQSEIIVDTDTADNTFGFDTTSEDGVPMAKSKAKTTSSGDFDKNHRQLTRTGNVGVTTSATMLTEELNIREFSIIERIFNDLDDLLAIKVRRV